MSNLAPNNGWISVTDRIPDTDRDIIIYSEKKGACCGWYSPFLQVWYGTEAAKIESVTHWRELPDPPRIEGEK